MAGQTNGAVVRRIVGDRRLERLAAAALLARLYRPVHLLVNPFQPPFKLADKSWEDAASPAGDALPAPAGGRSGERDGARRGLFAVFGRCAEAG